MIMQGAPVMAGMNRGTIYGGYGGMPMPQSQIPIRNAQQATPAALPQYLPATEQQQGGVFSGNRGLGLALMALGTIVSGLSKDPRAAERNAQALQTGMQMRQQADQNRLKHTLGALSMLPPGSPVPPTLLARLPIDYQRVIAANGGIMPG